MATKGADKMSLYTTQYGDRIPCRDNLTDGADDDDVGPGSGLRRRRNDNLAPMCATLDEIFGKDWDVPPIENSHKGD